MGSNVPGHTELIDGVIYDVSPQSPEHANAIEALNGLLCQGLDLNSYSIRIQSPIAVAGWTGPHAPEVDLVVIKKKEWYETTPEASDTLAAIEVSDTTYKYDRNHKIPLYIAVGIPAWIVNISKRQVESYPEERIYRDGEMFDALGVSIPVSRLFKPPKPSSGRRDSSHAAEHRAERRRATGRA